jgi:PAS domain S-box-containing protein
MPDLSDPQLPDPLQAAILEHVQDGLFILDDELTIHWVNQQALETFDLGYGRAELLGKPLVRIMPAEDVQICRSLISEIAAGQTDETRPRDVHLRTGGGRNVPVELELTPLSRDGSVQATAVVVRDVTDRRQREQRLRVLTRLLRHDLRTKANVISGRMEILEEDIAADHGHHVEAIYDSLQELTALSAKTLEVHRTITEAGDDTPVVDAVDVAESAAETAREQFPGADISLDLPDRAPIQADRTLDIVLENLLENAVRHSDRSTPTIELSVGTGADASADLVTVRVEDDGPGIPPRELEPLESGGETPLRHGSGLGLWLVKWVVQGFEGDLSFQEREPRGTIVTIRLPGA